MNKKKEGQLSLTYMELYDLIEKVSRKLACGYPNVNIYFSCEILCNAWLRLCWQLKHQIFAMKIARVQRFLYGRLHLFKGRVYGKTERVCDYRNKMAD